MDEATKLLTIPEALEYLKGKGLELDYRAFQYYIRAKRVSVINSYPANPKRGINQVPITELDKLLVEYKPRGHNYAENLRNIEKS
jgi:hypothetical protein